MVDAKFSLYLASGNLVIWYVVIWYGHSCNLIYTGKPRGNQLNKINLCKSFTTYISIWPIWAVSCTIYHELDLNFMDSLHTKFASYKVMEFANTNTLILTKFNVILLFDFFYSKGSLITSCTCAIWAWACWLFPVIFATSKYTHLMAFTHQIMWS